MTLLYATGFDMMGNLADLNADGWAANISGNGSGTVIDVQTTNGRGGGCCLRTNNGSSNGFCGARLNVPTQGASHAHSYVGWAMNIATASPNTSITVTLYDGQISAGNAQITLYVLTDGTIQITRGLSTVLGQTASGTVTFNTYHYYELDVVIGTGVTGSIVVSLDGIIVLTLTSQNTQNTGNGTWSIFDMGQAPTQFDLRMDDFYLCDGNGSAPFNANLGDIRIVGQLPTGNGTYQNMTKVGPASTHWQAVSERPSDGDTNYIASNVVNTMDTFTYPSVPANTASILAVQGRHLARKDDGGGRSIETHMRDIGTGFEADSVETTPLQTSYAYTRQLMLINPITGLAWTPADVNNMEFGPRVSA